MRTPLTDEENARVRQLAARLRAVQADQALASPEERRAALQTELAAGLADLPAEQRKRCLEAALELFPGSAQLARNGAVNEPPQPAIAEAAVSAAAPEALLDQFLATAANLGQEERNALARRIAEAGLCWVDREALVLEVADEVRKGLGLTGEQQPRLARIVQLTLNLIELLQRLDNTAVKVIGELAPRSSLASRPPEFREAIASFLTGATDTVEPQVRAVSSLLGGLLAALLGGGKEYGRQYVERFAPSSIEDVVKGEGKVGLFGNEKALCWDKYKDLAKDYATPEAIDRKIKDCMGAFAEKKALAGR